MQGVDVHGEVQLVADNLLVLAGEFISTVDALGVPVGPVEAVLKNCDGKWVWQAYRKRESEISEEMLDVLKAATRSFQERMSCFLKGSNLQSKQTQALSLAPL